MATNASMPLKNAQKLRQIERQLFLCGLTPNPELRFLLPAYLPRRHAMQQNIGLARSSKMLPTQFRVPLMSDVGKKPVSVRFAYLSSSTHIEI